MKKQLKSGISWLILVIWFLTGCLPSVDVPETNTVPPAKTDTATIYPMSMLTLTPTPIYLVLPATTLSPAESENALLDLLRTNGNCTGKCIGGIRPDEMTVQEAVKAMSQWGMISVSKNYFGNTIVTLETSPLENGKVGVSLAIGMRAKEFETIDSVGFGIRNIEGGRIETDLWEENRNKWIGFRLDNLLRAYGTPSYVGYDFYRLFAGRLNEGKTIGYIMEMQYQEISLSIYRQAIATYDGKNVFLCPTKDPQYFTMEIYPERPLDKRQEFASVTWQSLTGTDLNEFYQMFTNENDPYACVITNLNQIQLLKPSFH